MRAGIGRDEDLSGPPKLLLGVVDRQSKKSTDGVVDAS
jgi:hypothetical protein